MVWTGARIYAHARIVFTTNFASLRHTCETARTPRTPRRQRRFLCQKSLVHGFFVTLFFFWRCHDVDQAALARFTAASDRSSVVQCWSTVRRRNWSSRSRSGAPGLGKCTRIIEVNDETVCTFPHVFQRDHVRVQGYEHIPIGKTVSDVS